MGQISRWLIHFSVEKLKICSRPSKHFHILLPLHISCPGGCAALQVCTQLGSAFPPHRELCGTRLCIPGWKAEPVSACLTLLHTPGSQPCVLLTQSLLGRRDWTHPSLGCASFQPLTCLSQLIPLPGILVFYTCTSNSSVLKFFFFFLLKQYCFLMGILVMTFPVPPSGAHTEYLVSNQLIMPLFPCCR